MATVHRQTSASVDQVWSVLADAHTYAKWVVGAKEVRDADAEWPAVGSLLHHSVGTGPANIKDNTEVVEVDPPRHLKLRGRVRPIGLADIVIDLEERDGGCNITMKEFVVGGPARRFRGRLMNLLIKGRNAETLRRLSHLAEESSP